MHTVHLFLLKFLLLAIVCSVCAVPSVWGFILTSLFLKFSLRLLLFMLVGPMTEVHTEHIYILCIALTLS